MKKKVLTTGCNTCNLCTINDKVQFICNWGKGQPKIMEPAKGKKKISCKLINKDK